MTVFLASLFPILALNKEFDMLSLLAFSNRKLRFYSFVMLLDPLIGEQQHGFKEVLGGGASMSGSEQEPSSDGGLTDWSESLFSLWSSSSSQKAVGRGAR